jgi:hypothetical protein
LGSQFVLLKTVDTASHGTHLARTKIRREDSLVCTIGNANATPKAALNFKLALERLEKALQLIKKIPFFGCGQPTCQPGGDFGLSRTTEVFTALETGGEGGANTVQGWLASLSTPVGAR